MGRRPLFIFALLAWITCGCVFATVSIAQVTDVDPKAGDAVVATAVPAPLDMRSGGVLQESFRYHRYGNVDPRSVGPYQPHSTIAQPNGWYGYGFPVKTYRWGWFGASHYYPRVVWHRGYYGDYSRLTYRCGY